MIRGARILATIGPFADEILVMPSTVLKGTPEDAPYSFAFAIPCDTPGLRFLCRESFDLGRSHFDHPLALALRGDRRDRHLRRRPRAVGAVLRRRRAGALQRRSTPRPAPRSHMTHQVVTRTRAKTEFILGLVSLLTEAIGVEQFQHIQEKTAEVIVALETCKALLRSAEVDAELNRFGVVTPAWPPLNACRNWYPRTYPRLMEILRQIGASGLMALPTEADVFGPGRRATSRPTSSARRSTARSASGSSGSRGTRACRRSPGGSRSTSTSSSAIPCAWRARSSRATTASRTSSACGTSSRETTTRR